MYHLQHDHTRAQVDSAERAMLDYALKLNNSPGQMSERDLQPLRDAGFEDLGVMDIVMVVSLFNFMNRVADGLGVKTEAAMEKSRERGERRALEILEGGGAAEAGRG